MHTYSCARVVSAFTFLTLFEIYRALRARELLPFRVVVTSSGGEITLHITNNYKQKKKNESENRCVTNSSTLLKSCNQLHLITFWLTSWILNKCSQLFRPHSSSKSTFFIIIKCLFVFSKIINCLVLEPLLHQHREKYSVPSAMRHKNIFFSPFPKVSKQSLTPRLGDPLLRMIFVLRNDY